MPRLSLIALLVAALAIAPEIADAQARPQARPGVRSHTCPIDGGITRPVGHEGKRSLRRYSDLEEPTRAYQNAVLACPKCGYANWRNDFERPPTGQVVHYVRSRFKKSAKRAATDPIFAYRHHLNLLHLRGAGLREQIGAALFYSYVIKKSRPYGGMAPKVERRLVKARLRVLKLLRYAMKKEPPRRERGRLEWTYLIGELLRLTGRPGEASSILRGVCEAKRSAGHTVGRLSCQMADRAERKETWEDYRDGVYDVRGIDAAEKRAKEAAARAKAEAAKPKTVKPPAGTKPGKAPTGNAGSDKSANTGKAGKAQKAGKTGPKPPPAEPKGHDPKHLQPHHGDDPLAPPPPPPAK